MLTRRYKMLFHSALEVLSLPNVHVAILQVHACVHHWCSWYYSLVSDATSRDCYMRRYMTLRLLWGT